VYVMGNNRICVMHIMSSSEMAGGERHVFDLLSHGSERFAHLVLLPYPGPFQQMLREAGFEHRVVDMRKRFSVGSVLRIVKAIRRYRVRIVHTHGFRANFHGRLSCLITRAGHVCTVHVSLLDYRDTSPLLRHLYILIERGLSWMSQAYVCVSETMAEDMVKMGIRPEKVVVIKNGVDLARFHPRKGGEEMRRELGIRPGDRVVGTVGRLVREKGQIHLIEALGYLKDEWKNLKCMFIGEGPEAEFLRQKASELKVQDMCLFVGMRRDVEAIYPILDAFVLPSAREPFGLVLLEAMASEVPVIATSSGGPKEFIQSGVNGLLFPPEDGKALASRVSFLLSHRDESRSMALAGKKTAEERFPVKETVRRTEQVYLSLLGIPEETRGGDMQRRRIS
jgi:glycosyltransferase involved in cell wall biosynthesis